MLLKALLDGLGGGSARTSADRPAAPRPRDDPANLALLAGIAPAPPEVVASFAELRRQGAEKLASLGRTLN